MTKEIKRINPLEQAKMTKTALGSFRALINIDCTNDFLHDKGALTCGLPGQATIKENARITRQAIKDGVFVVFAIDKHKKGDFYHPESKLFVPHNIEDTWGRELYGELQEIYLENIDNPNVYYMDKTRYSAFTGTDLDIRLKERGIKVVDLIGVCSDICDLHTGISAYNRGYQIRVHSKAVASFDPVGHEYALKHMKNYLGAEIL